MAATSPTKKWKDFERLVERIHKSLHPGARITFDDKVVGLVTREERQIDIAIRETFGATELFIAVECKDWKRPIDVKAVEEFSGLKEDVGAHCGIIVSKMGFTRAARRLAKFKQINLFTLEDTARREWLNGIKMPVVCEVWTLTPLALRLRHLDGTETNFASDEGMTMVDINGRGNFAPATVMRMAWQQQANKIDGDYITSRPLYGHMQGADLEMVFRAKLTRCLRIARLDFLGLITSEKEVVSPSIKITAVGEAIPFPGEMFRDTPAGLASFGMMMTAIEVETEQSRRLPATRLLNESQLTIQITKGPQQPLRIRLGDSYSPLKTNP